MPVVVLGLASPPNAGDDLLVVESERKAREVALYRQGKFRDVKLARQAPRSEDVFSQMGEEKAGVVSVLIKADVQGSAEALRESLDKLSTPEVQVRVLGSALGGITVSDVQLAAASKALIIGFNVRADAGAQQVLGAGVIGLLAGRGDHPVGHEQAAQARRGQKAVLLVGEVGVERGPRHPGPADDVGHGDVRSSQLLDVAHVGIEPCNRRVVAGLLEKILAVLGDRSERIVVYFAAGDDRKRRIQQRRECAENSGLCLSTKAQQDEVVTTEEGIDDLRHDRLLVAYDAVEDRLPGCKTSQKIAAKLILD